MNKEDKRILGKGIIAGFLASLCCIGPVVLVMLGLAGVSTALTIGKFSWLFTILALGFLTASIAVYSRKKKCRTLKDIRRVWKGAAVSFLLFSAVLFLLKYQIAPMLARIAYGE